LNNLRYYSEKLEEEQQALAQGNAAMAADIFFQSDGEVDSMGFGDHMDSSNELEKDLHSPHKKPVKDGSHQSISSRTTTAVKASRDLLVYPFIAGNLMEVAGKGLLLGEDPVNCSSAHLLQLQQEKASQKKHFVTMQQEVIDRLQTGQYLNNCIIDFWMQWITRKEPMEENWIHIFNTQFFTALNDFGVDHVLQWTAIFLMFSQRNYLFSLLINNFIGLCEVLVILQQLQITLMMRLRTSK
jgi:hypothetical protein